MLTFGSYTTIDFGYRFKINYLIPKKSEPLSTSVITEELMLSMLGKICSRRHVEICFCCCVSFLCVFFFFFFFLFQKIGYDIACELSTGETICMKYQSLSCRKK